MKTTIIRSAIAIILCTFAIGGWADDLPFSEDFNTFADGQHIAIDGWTFKHCLGRATAYWDTKILTIQTEANKPSDKGYAITPPLNYTGGAVLSFMFCGTTNQGSSISISVNNGTINGEESVNVSSSNNKLTQMTYSLTLNQGATITFALTSNNYAAIDDILIVPDGIVLSETTDKAINNSIIEANDTKTVKVNTTRTLTGGIWNTLCLPFDVTMADLESALGYNQDITVRTFKSYNSTTKEITFENPFGGEPPSAIPAGTPFLIKLNTTVKDPTFQAVTIKNITPLGVSDNGVSFVGTYSPVILAADGTNLFLTTRNTLAVPADDEAKRRMNGLRAYFIVPSGFVPSAARLALNDEATDVQSVTMPSQHQSSGTYDLNGRRVEHPRHGLYVVDGRLTFVK